MSEPATVRPDHVVSFHFTLREDDGDVLDTTVGADPLEYLHGHGGLVPGLAAALDGKTVGTKFTIDVPPEEGYGLPKPNATRKIPRHVFPAGELHEGMQFFGPGPTGQPEPIWVVSADERAVEITTNHPMAGYTLHFEVEIVAVRPATAEELEHGHAHGPHGHGHH